MGRRHQAGRISKPLRHNGTPYMGMNVLLLAGETKAKGFAAPIADLTYQKLAWCTNWYVRDETLKAATTRLVNFQYRQPLSRFWGTGPLRADQPVRQVPLRGQGELEPHPLTPTPPPC